jgi:hypothetical protein
MKALEKNPEARPASAIEFADALRRVRRRNPYAIPVVRPASKPDPVKRLLDKLRGLLGR